MPTCPVGTFPFSDDPLNSICQACDSETAFCKTCAITASYCKSCVPGKILDNGICIDPSQCRAFYHDVDETGP